MLRKITTRKIYKKKLAKKNLLKARKSHFSTQKIIQRISSRSHQNTSLMLGLTLAGITTSAGLYYLYQSYLSVHPYDVVRDTITNNPNILDLELFEYLGMADGHSGRHRPKLYALGSQDRYYYIKKLDEPSLIAELLWGKLAHYLGFGPEVLLVRLNDENGKSSYQFASESLGYNENLKTFCQQATNDPKMLAEFYPENIAVSLVYSLLIGDIDNKLKNYVLARHNDRLLVYPIDNEMAKTNYIDITIFSLNAQTFLENGAIIEYRKDKDFTALLSAAMNKEILRDNNITQNDQIDKDDPGTGYDAYSQAVFRQLTRVIALDMINVKSMLEKITAMSEQDFSKHVIDPFSSFFTEKEKNNMTSEFRNMKEAANKCLLQIEQTENLQHQKQKSAGTPIKPLYPIRQPDKFNICKQRQITQINKNLFSDKTNCKLTASTYQAAEESPHIKIKKI